MKIWQWAACDVSAAMFRLFLLYEYGLSGVQDARPGVDFLLCLYTQHTSLVPVVSRASLVMACTISAVELKTNCPK